MTWFDKLLRNAAPTSQSQRRAAKDSPLVAAMRRGAQPCLRLVASGIPTLTKLGVLPTPELACPWPEWQGKPMDFVAQIDLAAARGCNGPSWLPGEGLLLFFYATEANTWGFDPADRGSWAVIHVRAAAESAVPASAPGYDLQLCEAVSYPSADRFDALSAAATDEECEEAWALSDFEGPAHQIGGLPRPIQGDTMELECQLASNGIYVGNGDGYRSEAAQALKLGAKDWRLLLQVDSDERADMMWGDSGRLYFWIKERDAMARDFSKAWIILQCC